ncbi:hypothetical protein Tco_0481490 [Tanacetum coccineum]
MYREPSRDALRPLAPRPSCAALRPRSPPPAPPLPPLILKTNAPFSHTSTISRSQQRAYLAHRIRDSIIRCRNALRSGYARAMIELRADVELKDTIGWLCLNLLEEGFIREECPKNLGLGVAKNLTKPSQAPRGVLVGPKVGFKPAKEYRPVSKKPTTNTSGNKKKRGTSNLASNMANSSGSSFWNVETSSTSTTPIVDKIRKLEKLIIDGKVTLVDDDGKPLKKVDYPGDHDSEDEVESVDNDMARSMALERVGFGTKSLLEQWKDSYENGDYDEDPYDDDMYEGQDFPDKIQDICDNLDIRVRGRRKK